MAFAQGFGEPNPFLPTSFTDAATQAASPPPFQAPPPGTPFTNAVTGGPPPAPPLPAPSAPSMMVQDPGTPFTNAAIQAGASLPQMQTSTPGAAMAMDVVTAGAPQPGVPSMDLGTGGAPPSAPISVRGSDIVQHWLANEPDMQTAKDLKSSLELAALFAMAAGGGKFADFMGSPGGQIMNYSLDQLANLTKAGLIKAGVPDPRVLEAVTPATLLDYGLQNSATALLLAGKIDRGQFNKMTEEAHRTLSGLSPNQFLAVKAAYEASEPGITEIHKIYVQQETLREQMRDREARDRRTDAMFKYTMSRDVIQDNMSERRYALALKANDDAAYHQKWTRRSHAETEAAAKARAAQALSNEEFDRLKAVQTQIQTAFGAKWKENYDTVQTQTSTVQSLQKQLRSAEKAATTRIADELRGRALPPNEMAAQVAQDPTVEGLKSDIATAQANLAKAQTALDTTSIMYDGEMITDPSLTPYAQTMRAMVKVTSAAVGTLPTPSSVAATQATPAAKVALQEWVLPYDPGTRDLKTRVWSRVSPPALTSGALLDETGVDNLYTLLSTEDQIKKMLPAFRSPEAFAAAQRGKILKNADGQVAAPELVYPHALRIYQFRVDQMNIMRAGGSLKAGGPTSFAPSEEETNPLAWYPTRSRKPEKTEEEAPVNATS